MFSLVPVSSTPRIALWSYSIFPAGTLVAAVREPLLSLELTVPQSRYMTAISTIFTSRHQISHNPPETFMSVAIRAGIPPCTKSPSLIPPDPFWVQW